MHTATILLGSNIDAELNLTRAIQTLENVCGIIATSKIWLTKAVGSGGPDFLNQAVLIQTELDFENLKNNTLQSIEKQLGRVRTADKYAARTIDLDVIIFDNQVMDPAVWTQCFIASPVSDLHPELQSPTNGSTLLDVARELQCNSDVRIYCK
jgi:2-amino-4-hydroxy-6-hydroxymethyldihydropteridine diphosphokinase/dihydroneopterin aldolase/2-amino-4-hydroxy-6-hydroxymethyldihydropteridine diphosphokinase